MTSGWLDVMAIRYVDDYNNFFLAAVAAVFVSLFLSDRKDKARHEANPYQESSGLGGQVLCDVRVQIPKKTIVS